MIEIFTDGSCQGNGQLENIGGNGFVLLINKEYSLHYTEVNLDTTNNRQELLGLINSLNHVKKNNLQNVIIYTDSQYVQKGATQWMHKWHKNNWKRGKKSKEDIKNPDLWKKLYLLYTQLNPKIEWVRGHQDPNSDYKSKWNNFIDMEISKDISYN